MIVFCDPYKAWLQSDRKQPPPCWTCAEVNSTLNRADEMEKQVASMRTASRKLMSEHPGGAPDAG